MVETKIAGLGPNERFIGVKGSRMSLSTPALLLDLDVLDRNITAMAAHAKKTGIQVRPHSKGGKSIAIARRQVAAGAIGICCATIGEAEVIAGAGIENVLITSPVVTPGMIDRLITLNGRAKGLLVVADNPANVDALATACAVAGQILSLLVEFDVGQGRTGTTSVEAATALAQRIQASPHLRYAGVQGYYGHLQHVADFGERRIAAEAQMVRLRALLEHLKSIGAAAKIVSGGGTGTFDIDPSGGVFTEVQAGSYPFMDREYRRDRHVVRPVVALCRVTLCAGLGRQRQSRGFRRGQCRIQVLRHRGRHAHHRQPAADQRQLQADGRRAWRHSNMVPLAER